MTTVLFSHIEVTAASGLDPSQPLRNYLLAQERNIDFESRTHEGKVKYKRAYVIGARSVPGVTARMVYILAQAGVPQIYVKSPNLGESYLVDVSFGGRGLVGQWDSQQDDPPEWWFESEEDLSDSLCVAYGGDLEYKTHLEHLGFKDLLFFGPTVSFGLITENDVLFPQFVKMMADDFTDYMGMGCMSPRRYFVPDSYRGLLAEPLTKEIQKVFQEQGVIEWLGGNLSDTMLRVAQRQMRNRVSDQSESSFYEVRPVDYPLEEELLGFGSISYYTKLDQVVESVHKYSSANQVSTVGISMTSMVSMGSEIMKINPSRTCPVGSMQAPRFWGRRDWIDEWEFVTA